MNGNELTFFELSSAWWLLLVVFVAITYTLGAYSRRRALKLMTGKSSRKILSSSSKTRRLVRVSLALFAVALMAIALMRPQLGEIERKVARRGLDIVVCLDVSRSMNATDMPPSREVVAKRKIADLLKILNGDRVGIVAFAGDSAVICPLSVDYKGVLSLLSGVDELSVLRGGTDLSSALRRAIKCFDLKSKTSRAILLLSDGDDLASSNEALLEELKAENIHIFSVGLGSDVAVSIPDKRGDGESVIRDKDGKPAFSRLNRGLLKSLAAATKGAYVNAQLNDADLLSLYEKIKQLPSKELASMSVAMKYERFQIPLMFAFFAIVLYPCISERKRGF